METKIFHGNQIFASNSPRIALSFAYDYFVANCETNDLLVVHLDNKRVFFYVDESGQFVLDHGENECGDSIWFEEPEIHEDNFDTQFASDERVISFLNEATKVS